MYYIFSLRHLPAAPTTLIESKLWEGDNNNITQAEVEAEGSTVAFIRHELL